MAVVHGDQEFGLVAEPLKAEFNFELCLANAEEHVPEAERNNRFIKERMRTAFHTLPHKSLPKLAVVAVVMELTRKTNFFPA